MKKLSNLFLIMILAKNMVALGLGNSTGGGAFTVDCPSNPIEPAQSILLDLYEGAYVHNFKMRQASGSIEKDYFDSIEATYTLQGFPGRAEPRREEILLALKSFFRSVKFVESSADLPKSNDIGYVPEIPSQCKINQVAYFDDVEKTIFILKPTWDNMDTLSQAALVQHELHYHFKRQQGEDTSILTRRTVSHIFAQKGPIPVNGDMQGDYFDFKIESDFMSLFKVMPGFILDSPVVRLQFQFINGYGLVAKTWADVFMPSWNLTYEYSKGEPKRYCVVTTPNTDLIKTAPLQGTLYPNGYQVRIEYKTNLPVRVSILKPNGTVLTEGSISGGNNCK